MKKEKPKRFGILKLLDYARFALAGGIGGIAIYNTFMVFVASTPAQSAESIAMGAGAVIATGVVKVLHIV